MNSDLNSSFMNYSTQAVHHILDLMSGYLHRGMQKRSEFYFLGYEVSNLYFCLKGSLKYALTLIFSLFILLRFFSSLKILYYFMPFRNISFSFFNVLSNKQPILSNKLLLNEKSVSE